MSDAALDGFASYALVAIACLLVGLAAHRSGDGRPLNWTFIGGLVLTVAFSFRLLTLARFTGQAALVAVLVYLTVAALTLTASLRATHRRLNPPPKTRRYYLHVSEPTPSGQGPASQKPKRRFRIV